MTPFLARLTAGVPLRVALLTYALGGVGGLLARWIGLPLGVLLGAMVSVTALSALGFRPWGHGLAVPQKWRNLLVPVIGVAIGASFPADFVAQAQHWWVTMAALVLFVPTAQFLGYQLYARVGGLTPATAYYAAMPGGFIESLEMGERAGAEMPMLVMLQFLRLILTIVAIPIAFSLIEGHAVGSAAGLSIAGTHPDLTARHIAELAGLALGGWFLALRLNFPAAVLSGPLLLSGLAHATGLTQAVPPGWAVLVTQWVIGTSLGARLSGFTRGQAGRALTLAALNVGAMLGVATLIALFLAPRVDEPMSAVVLAFAPGGVSEMSLVALSLHLSAVFVTMHHLARIILAVLVSRAGQRFLRR